MLRYIKRVLMLGVSGGVLAMVALMSPGQPIIYPNSNGQCTEAGYHPENVHSVDFTIQGTLGPVTLGVTKGGNEIMQCFPNEPGSYVSGDEPPPNQNPATPMPLPTPDSTPVPPPSHASEMLDDAVKELAAAQAAADAALAALEKCQQQAVEEAKKKPDGVKHSPGYTGKGAGYDRHEHIIDLNPCQAQHEAFDAAHEAFQHALHNYEDALQMAEHPELGGIPVPTPAPQP